MYQYRTESYLNLIKQVYDVIKYDENFVYKTGVYNMFGTTFINVEDKVSLLPFLSNIDVDTYELEQEELNSNGEFLSRFYKISKNVFNSIEEVIPNYLNYRNDAYKVLAYISRGFLWQWGQLENINKDSEKEKALFKIVFNFIDFSSFHNIKRFINKALDNDMNIVITKEDVLNLIASNKDVIYKCLSGEKTNEKEDMLEFFLTKFNISQNEILKKCK